MQLLFRGVIKHVLEPLSMELFLYKITALPFAQSDVEADYTEYAVDEDTAYTQFMKRYPSMRIKEIREA